MFLARSGFTVLVRYTFYTVLHLICTHRTVKKFRDIERDTCRRMFGQGGGGGSKSTNSSSGKATSSKGDNGDHISPAELAKIRSLYVERFRQVYSILLIVCMHVGRGERKEKERDERGRGESNERKRERERERDEVSLVYWNSMFESIYLKLL